MQISKHTLFLAITEEKQKESERERAMDRERDGAKENPFTIIMTLMLSKINRITIASIFHSLEAFKIVLHTYIYIYIIYISIYL